MKSDFKKVINPQNLPTKLPIGETILCFLALDYWNAPIWLWWVLGILFFIRWIVSITSLTHQYEVDIDNLLEKSGGKSSKRFDFKLKIKNLEENDKE